MSNFTDCLGNADYKSEIYYVTYKIKKQISLTIQNISKDIGNGYSSVLLVGVEIGITFLKNNFVKGRKVKNTLASTQQFLFYVVAVQSLSRVQLFGISWTIAPQSPLSMGFPRKEYILFQGLFLTQVFNTCLLNQQADSLPLSHQ